jgi:PAS domain S-box-containing protein
MEATVVVGVSLLVGLSLGAVLLVTTRVLMSWSLTRASEELAAARSAFSHLVDTRAEFAAAQTRLITALPVFRAHMTDSRLASDATTIDAMADEYRRQLKAQFCIVTDRDGRWTGSPGWPADEKPSRAIQSSIAAALTGGSHRDLSSIRDQLFLVVSEPALFAEETLGTLTVGYALDDAVAEELALVTHCEVNLVAGDHLCGSSLHKTERTELAAILAGGDLRARGGVSLDEHRVGGVRYVAGAFPLSADRESDGVGRLVLLQDWRPTQRFLDQLQRQLVQAGFAIFTLALAAGLVFSKRMSRPLRDIAVAASDIASGNWAHQVPVRGTAEATTMAVTFNEMSASLRHWHEEARDKSERLQRSYDRFHSVTESARDAIISTDQSGAITLWSKSAGTIFGYEESEALGHPLTRFIAEPDRQAYLDAVTAIRSGASSVTSGRTLEIVAARKNGDQFPVELSLSAWQAGGTTHYTVVGRDVTERKQTETALRQREDQLRQAQKMEAIGRLAGGVAHDFNNVLTAIRGYGELVLESFDDGDARRADADEILKAADRAAGLTLQLLAFSRRQVLAPQVLALDEVVAGTEKMLRRLIGEDIELTFVSEAGLGRVLADRGQVEQVLINLVVNARDAMPTGGKLHVELDNVELKGSVVRGLSSAGPGGYVRLSVSDAGCGMSPEIVAQIFEPFFTTKAEGEGTGLGLATVYGIVQQSGGTIEVETQPGAGTTFRVYLPQVAGIDAVPRLLRPVRPSSRGVETILLVEDDERVRALIGILLKKSGYAVLEAAHGEQALDIARTYDMPIQLLLTDVVMPGISGRVLAERLASLRSETRVLFMSGYSDDAMLRHGVQAGGMQFIQKPFSIDALAAKIREALEATPPLQ